jgi:integrase/recombinase XerD
MDVPVEYAVAVDRYLGQAALGDASRRVYRISLAGWAWPLVGKPIPGGRAGAPRRSSPPRRSHSIPAAAAGRCTSSAPRHRAGPATGNSLTTGVSYPLSFFYS